jgi:hypothetical protein
MKIGTGFQKSFGGDAHTDTQRALDLISLFSFFQNKEIRLKIHSEMQSWLSARLYVTYIPTARRHESEYTAVTGQWQLNWQHIWSSHQTKYVLKVSVCDQAGAVMKTSSLTVLHFLFLFGGLFHDEASISDYKHEASDGRMTDER